LRSCELATRVEVAKLYQMTLHDISTYAEAKAYTGMIEDFLLVCKDLPARQVLVTLIAILVESPPGLVKCERIIGKVLHLLEVVADGYEEGQWDLVTGLAIPIVRYFIEHMRETEDEDAAGEIAQIISIIVNSAELQQHYEYIACLLVELRNSVTRSPLSLAFCRSMVKGAQTAEILIRVRGAVTEVLNLPFDTDYIELTNTDLRSLVVDDLEQARLQHLDSLTLATSHYEFEGKKMREDGLYIHLVEGLEPSDQDSARQLGLVLAQRVDQRHTVRPRLKPCDVSPLDG
jgi:hypothetical protein